MPASSNSALRQLLFGYALCASSEGKSPRTIQLVQAAVGYLEDFLVENGLSADVNDIGPAQLRLFVVYLQGKPRFRGHPYIKPGESKLSGHSVNSYLRSIRAFWSWLVREELIENNPFFKVKLPRAPHKVIPAFSAAQFQALISQIDDSTPEGFRDTALLTVLLDTALRVSELTGLEMKDMHLKEGYLKVCGKGDKERLIPIGRTSQRLLWKYTSRYRPDPVPGCASVFLNKNGLPLNKNRVEAIMKKCQKKAGITGVRCSPHTLRHTGAVMYLRNGGDVFTLQRLLGHSTLEMTRHYCELADVDLKKAHLTASPADNLARPQAGRIDKNTF